MDDGIITRRHVVANHQGVFISTITFDIDRLIEDLKSSGLPHDQAKGHCSGYCRGTNRNHLKLLLAFLVARRCLHSILIDDHRKIRGFHYYFNVIIKDLRTFFSWLPIRINLKILIHHEDTKFTKKNQSKIFVFFVVKCLNLMSMDYLSWLPT
jgi:hypothetical protein